MRNSEAASRKIGAKIDRHCLVPKFERDVGDLGIARQICSHISGIIMQYVEPTEPLNREGDKRLDGFDVGGIECLPCSRSSYFGRNGDRKSTRLNSSH